MDVSESAPQLVFAASGFGVLLASCVWVMGAPVVGIIEALALPIVAAVPVSALAWALSTHDDRAGRGTQ